jgi:hypothetical protein
MKATKFFAAAVVFVAAGSAFAADAPAVAAASTAAVTSAATVGVASSLNVPAITITQNIGRSRAEVHAEAVETVKNYKTTLATQLELAKN